MAQNTDLFDLILAFLIGSGSHKKHEVTKTYREVLGRDGRVIILKTIVDKQVR